MDYIPLILTLDCEKAQVMAGTILLSLSGSGIEDASVAIAPTLRKLKNHSRHIIHARAMGS